MRSGDATKTKLARRRAFEAEARRQCLEANAAARDPDSDEAAVMRELAAVMRELEANLAEFADEWS